MARANVREFVVRLDPDLHDQVKERAERDERTMSQTIRYALKRYLAEEHPPTIPAL